MLSAPRACREPGCGKIAERDGGGYCAAHKDASSALEARRQFDRDRADEPTRKMYATVRWLTFRSMMLARRPICQRLIHGVRCTNPSRVIHHLFSPRTHPQFFIDPDRVLALCPTCHTPEAGTPNWRPGFEYEYMPFELPTVG